MAVAGLVQRSLGGAGGSSTVPSMAGPLGNAHSGDMVDLSQVSADQLTELFKMRDTEGEVEAVFGGISQRPRACPFTRLVLTAASRWEPPLLRSRTARTNVQAEVNERRR
jgi:hypothetical protein